MGRMQRDKGLRGQREFAQLLNMREWEILQSSTGSRQEDFLGRAPSGQLYSIEVKNHKIINLSKFRRQAREQAERRKGIEWLLACRLNGFPNTFLVIWSNGEPEIWSQAVISD